MKIDRKNLTEEQLKALDRAAFKIIIGHREAAEILRSHGIPHELPSVHCTGMLPGDLHCSCDEFQGNNPYSCAHRITILTGNVPFDVDCGHPASKHFEI
jgi:Family of unknown function (DUF6422)